MYYFILYMFRAAICPSSGELLYQCDKWFMSLCVDDRLVRIPDGHPLHASGSHVPIMRRVIVSMRNVVYVALCRRPSGMHPHRVT